ncbi:hypothetical protein C2G38_2222012 [Gigaspora rosea]|uniref:Uncharacterized protein n=1 Tax=Gigaspora rosea TaxID=44941 RepID=A0A397U690_9GLOM|nr:hypothetical protein C2G38_2222012 [Gigaspora rosea]
MDKDICVLSELLNQFELVELQIKALGITDTFGLRELLLENINLFKNSQVEGLFNKLDLKTHSNMALSVKQSKLQLFLGKIRKENLLKGLKEIRANRKKTPLQKTQTSLFGPNIATKLFNNLLC